MNQDRRCGNFQDGALIIGTKSCERKQYGIDVMTTSSRTPNERGVMIATEPARFSNRRNAIILRFMAVHPSVRYARAVALPQPRNRYWNRAHSTT